VARAQSDEAIRLRLQTELEGQSWWQSKWCSVLVSNGLVRYTGISDSDIDWVPSRASTYYYGLRRVRLP